MCYFCGTCVSVCPDDAIELTDNMLIIDDKKWTLCLRCVRVCPLEVLEVGS